MKRVVRGVWGSVVCLLASCGGGGDAANVPRYAGSWSGSVSLAFNDCPRQIPDEFLNLYLLHNVDQAEVSGSNDESALEIVVDDGGDTYVGLGQVKADGTGNRFSVTGTPHELPGFLSGFRCVEIIDFSYQSIDFSSSTAGYVERHSSITCTRGEETQRCDVNYTGSSYRTADPNSAASPDLDA